MFIALPLHQHTRQSAMSTWGWYPVLHRLPQPPSVPDDRDRQSLHNCWYQLHTDMADRPMGRSEAYNHCESFKSYIKATTSIKPDRTSTRKLLPWLTLHLVTLRLLHCETPLHLTQPSRGTLKSRSHCTCTIQTLKFLEGQLHLN
jgi:hypothetical protein